MCDGNCSFYDRSNNRKSPSPKFRVSVIELEPYCKPSSCTLMPGSNFCSIPVSFAFLTRSRRRFCDVSWNKNGVSKVRASYVNMSVM